MLSLLACAPPSSETAVDPRASTDHFANVIADVRRGYGGALMEDDPSLRTPEFVAAFLRAFAAPDDTTTKGLASYAYRFERFGVLVWEAPAALDDPGLD